MRLLFVVQRYGHEVFGGAEFACRQFASRLVGRGHDVDVLTSCAVSYVDWANAYPPGVSSIDGVTVHRLPVDEPRDDRWFGPLNSRVVWGHRPVPLYLQRQWIKTQGPSLPDLPSWLWEHAVSYEAVIFFTYLYYTAWAGLPVAAARQVPTVLHPTAHNEPPLYLRLYDTMFRHATGFGFLTEEEAALVSRRFRVRRPSVVTGVGIDTDVEADEAKFRSTYSLEDRPYLLFLGRVDPGKGSDELFDYFVAYKERHPGPLSLVVVGEPVTPPPPRPDVVVTGFVDEGIKQSALAGATALVQPSYFESFSMALTEAWVHGKPAIVQRNCDVLLGQIQRSGGGIPYQGFAEFEAALELVLEDEDLARRLGQAGRDYALRRYEWREVLENYEWFLGKITHTAARRRA